MLSLEHAANPEAESAANARPRPREEEEARGGEGPGGAEAPAGKALARRHLAAGWATKRSARVLLLAPRTVSRWRERWASGAKRPRRVGRPKGTYRGRNLRCAEKRHPALREEARRLLVEMQLPDSMSETLQKHPRAPRTGEAIVSHARAVGLSIQAVRRLLDLLATAGSPYPQQRGRRWRREDPEEALTAFDIARQGLDDEQTTEGLSKRNGLVFRDW
jgi:hypothetical protein